MTKDMNQGLEDFYKQFNATSTQYNKETTIIHLFKEQVKRTPDADAVVFRDKVLSYKKLDEKSSQLACYLRKKQVGAKDIVGIMIDRSLEMVIGLFGILKCGAAYLPILPSTPVGRIDYIMKDSQMKCLLTESKYLSSLTELEIDIYDLHQPEIYEEDTECEIQINPKDLMYIIYTSGSTGQPKGVMIEHASVVNRLSWMQRKYPIGSEDTILQKTSFAFDVSVWELFWWSITGARVCMLEPGYEKFPQGILMEVERSKVTTMHFVPSVLGVFLHYIDGSSENERVKSLIRVFCSGETLVPAQVNLFQKLIGREYGTKLVNLYGPTEATVDVTYYDCPSKEVETVPIGKPIDNIRLYVIKDGTLVGPGEEGELHIAGDGLARGYLNQPQLTDERFIVWPEVFGERLYKTGDNVRILQDGNIEFIGRADGQIKLRGLRIELGEIEQRLNLHKSIEQSVVAVDNAGSVNAQLIAYIQCQEEVSRRELIRYLSEYLPDYMIPNKFVKLEAFPLNANGKVDRKALKNRK